MENVKMLEKEKTLPALVDLEEETRKRILNSKSVATIKAYRSAWAQFVSFTEKFGLKTLPAEPKDVAMFLTLLASEGKKASTVKKICAAISSAHKTAGFQSPVDTEIVRATLNGIFREIGTSKAQKSPLLVEDLQRILNIIPDTIVGTRDRALILTTWAGALRGSESISLRVEDLEFSNEGLIVRLQRSKTDQLGEGQMVAIPFASNPNLCCIRAMKNWLQQGEIENGFVFRSFKKGGKIRTTGIRMESFNRILKEYARQVGMDPGTVGTHSCRSGYCTTAAKKGKTAFQIKQHTRHKNTSSLDDYVRLGRIFSEDHASYGLL